VVKMDKQKTPVLWENMEEQNHKGERKQPNLNNVLQQQAAAKVILKNSVHNRRVPAEDQVCEHCFPASPSPVPP